VNQLAHGPSTARKALSGVRWVTFGMGFQKAFQLFAVVVLARLLTPADFGLVTVATLTLGALNRIKQLGLHSALVQRRTEVQEAANACFVMTGLFSMALYVMVLTASPFIAEYFASPQARSVLNILALSLLIDAASGVQSAWAIRNMQFRKHSIIGSAEMLVTSIVSMALAFLGFGLWALVWGTLAGPFVGAIIWWKADPWRPGGAFSMKVLREMFNFGIKLSLAGSLDGLTDTAIRAVVGRTFGIVSLGFFDFAMRLVQLPFKQIMALTQRVALPAYCRELDDPGRVGQWHLMVTRYSCLLMGFVATTLVVLADPLIPLIFGRQWLPAVRMIRIFAPIIFLLPLLYAWSVHSSTGRLEPLVAFMAARLVFTFVAVGWAARFGIIAASATLLAVTAIFSGVHLVLVGHRLKLNGAQWLGAVAMPGIVCLASGLAMQGVRLIVTRFVPDHALVVSVIALGIGFMVAGSTVYIIYPRAYRDLRQLVHLIPEPRTAPVVSQE
jgi:O-antigen/teichoic acid export membrane protein